MRGGSCVAVGGLGTRQVVSVSHTKIHGRIMASHVRPRRGCEALKGVEVDATFAPEIARVVRRDRRGSARVCISRQQVSRVCHLSHCPHRHAAQRPASARQSTRVRAQTSPRSTGPHPRRRERAGTHSKLYWRHHDSRLLASVRHNRAPAH